jgi:hypothetical protein
MTYDRRRQVLTKRDTQRRAGLDTGRRFFVMRRRRDVRYVTGDAPRSAHDAADRGHGS